ncbi:protein held out wings-like [Centruroides sculpturatus]|uniref:protein held out wings-like n=1 Tax=Centruroides sculpturatus TaxID=218467 RepID=UPI000C6EBD57|nr:protein held out wings-like [Centruroides sculpturatus]
MASPITISAPLQTPGNPLGAPLILSPRLPMAGATLLNGSAPPPHITPTDAGLLYAPYADYHQFAALAASPLLADFAAEHSSSGAVAKQKHHLAIRDHPYQRVGSLS